MKRAAAYCAGALAALCGCGTIVPGPRYQITVDDFAFGDGGAEVVYLEDRFRFYPLLLGAREGRVLCLYDCARRRHRLLAKTGAFSASPYAPLVLYAPDWKARFRARGASPDFHLLDYATGTNRGYSMPPGFDDGYLTYSIPEAEWDRAGGVTALVYFYYAPGKPPASWIRLAPARCDWRRELWEVRIDGGERAVARAARSRDNRPPRGAWKDLRAVKRVSPDGARELAYTRYTGRCSFNTTLAVVPRRGGAPEYIARENRLINFAQVGKYSILYAVSAPVFGIRDLFHGVGGTR